MTQFIGGLQIRDPLIQEGFGLPGNHQREDGNSDGNQSRQEIHTSPQRCVGAHDGTSQHGDQNDAWVSFVYLSCVILYGLLHIVASYLLMIAMGAMSAGGMAYILLRGLPVCLIFASGCFMGITVFPKRPSWAVWTKWWSKPSTTSAPAPIPGIR